MTCVKISSQSYIGVAGGLDRFVSILNLQKRLVVTLVDLGTFTKELSLSTEGDLLLVV